VDAGGLDAMPTRRGPATGQRRRGWRALWVVVHRWAGLTLALFLAVAGLTGALLAFYPELHRATAPWLRVVPPAPTTTPPDPVAVLEAAQRAEPRADFLRLELAIKPDTAVVYYPDPRPGKDLGYDELGIDPWTGAAVHRGTWGAISEGWHQLMPFLFELHYTLALGEIGRLAFGIAALVWTLDCFVGFYLTLPAGPRRWWQRWREAWTVRPLRSGAFRFNFDLHRAGGLWLWPLLLVFAWSSVGFNLRPVYTPIMAAFGASDPIGTLRTGPRPKAWRTTGARASRRHARSRPDTAPRRDPPWSPRMHCHSVPGPTPTNTASAPATTCPPRGRSPASGSTARPGRSSRTSTAAATSTPTASIAGWWPCTSARSAACPIGCSSPSSAWRWWC
jgi:uncharacterized iron-regulated membrane protein